MEFIICYVENGNSVWENIIGEDAMQCRVGDLMEELNCELEDILVFDLETQW